MDIKEIIRAVGIEKKQLQYFIGLFILGILFLVYGSVSYAQLPAYHEIGIKYIKNDREISEALCSIRRVSRGRVLEHSESNVTLVYIINGMGSKEVLLFFSKNEQNQWEVDRHEVDYHQCE